MKYLFLYISLFILKVSIAQDPVDIVSKAFEPFQNSNYQWEFQMSINKLDGGFIDSDKLKIGKYNDYTSVEGKTFIRYDNIDQSIFINHDLKEVVYLENKLDAPESLYDSFGMMISFFEKNKDYISLIDKGNKWLVKVNRNMMGFSEVSYTINKSDYSLLSFSAKGRIHPSLQEECILELYNFKKLNIENKWENWDELKRYYLPKNNLIKPYPNYRFQTLSTDSY